MLRGRRDKNSAWKRESQHCVRDADPIRCFHYEIDRLDSSRKKLDLSWKSGEARENICGTAANMLDHGSSQKITNQSVYWYWKALV